MDSNSKGYFLFSWRAVYNGSMDKPDKLNAKQWLFTLAYAETGHGTNSAIKAGYSKKTAYAIASNLLKKVEIKKALQELWETNTMTAGEVLNGIASLARYDEDSRVRLKAYETMGKNINGGMWTDKTDTTGDLNIIVTIGDDGD